MERGTEHAKKKFSKQSDLLTMKNNQRKSKEGEREWELMKNKMWQLDPLNRDPCQQGQEVKM